MKVNDSERLSFALMGPEDALLLFELDQDIEVMRYINGGKMSTMDDIHQVFIPRMAKYSDTSKGWGLWKVLTKENQEFLGWVLVRPMDFFNENTQWDNIELGWRFKRMFWGKGYATEAAQQISEALIQQTDIKKLSAIAVPENESSINIMKKLGMHYIKTALHKDPLGDLQAVYYERDVN